MKYIDWTLPIECFLLHDLTNEEYYQVIKIAEQKDYYGVKIVTYVKNNNQQNCLVNPQNGFVRDSNYRGDDFRPMKIVVNEQKAQNIIFEQMLKRLINIEKLLMDKKEENHEK